MYARMNKIGGGKMVKPIVKDVMFPGQKSDLITEKDYHCQPGIWRYGNAEPGNKVKIGEI